MKQNQTPRMFSLYLVEDDDGIVRVVSDWTGEGERALRLGCEILANLAAIQPATEGKLQLHAAAVSDTKH